MYRRIYMCVCVYICEYVCVYICMWGYKYICIVCAYLYECEYIYVCMSVMCVYFINVYECVYIYVCECVNIYVGCIYLYVSMCVLIYLCEHVNIQACMCTRYLHLRPTLCDPTDCSPPGSSVHGILQTRILEWVAMLSSRRSSWPRDWTHVS